MKKLSIPERINLNREYLPGLGKRELLHLSVAALPGFILTVVLWCCLPEPGQRVLALFCGIGFFGCCYACVVKVDGTQSMYTYIARIIRFYQKQKHYYYKQVKEVLYEVGEEKRP